MHKCRRGPQQHTQLAHIPGTTLLFAWSALLERCQNYVQFVLQPFYTAVNEETVETQGWFDIISVFCRGYHTKLQKLLIRSYA